MEDTFKSVEPVFASDQCIALHNYASVRDACAKCRGDQRILMSWGLKSSLL